jgi:hypothetical protein
MPTWLLVLVWLTVCALLSALSLAGEATRLRVAEENVSREGAATARLAGLFVR